MSKKAPISAEMLQVHLLLNRYGHLDEHPANPLIAAAIKHARNAEQRDVLLVLWRLYDQSMKTEDPTEKLDICIRMLANVMNRLEDMDGMSDDFLRKLFQYGVQALKMIESTQGQVHGGRKLEVDKVMSENAAIIMSPKSKSAKNKKAVRRNIVMGQLTGMMQHPPEDMERFLMFLPLMQLCNNKAMKAHMESGSVIDLPEIKTFKTDACGKEVEADPLWEEEMWTFVCGAICLVAQCLGHRYMRWPVELRGKQVPLTGNEDPETLEDWKALDEKEWAAGKGKKENQRWMPGKIVVVNTIAGASEQGSDKQSEQEPGGQTACRL